MEAETSVPEIIVLHIPEGGTGRQRLDLWLVEQLPQLSRSRIQQLLIDSHIFAPDGTELHAKDHPDRALEIHVAIPPPPPAEPQPEDIPLDVVYEDKDILVLDKPAGLVIHPAAGHPDGTLVNALLHHCKGELGAGGTQRPGIVHRLDKDTSGLMACAKSDAAMVAFGELFQTGKVHKEYLCLIHGAPPKQSDTIVTLLARHPVLRQHWAVVPRNGKNAITHYWLERRIGPISLMRVKIDTGRTHQIRIHMAHIGHPIIGDGFYGRPSFDAQLSPVPQRQMLHATRLCFPHPITGEAMSFEREPPADFKAYL